MLPCMFVCQQKEYLRVAVTEIGVEGRYDSEDLWEWFKGAAEGFGREWYSNWMATWQWICTKYRAREWQGEEDDSKISRHSSADIGVTDNRRKWSHSSVDSRGRGDRGGIRQNQGEEALREHNQKWENTATAREEQE